MSNAPTIVLGRCTTDNMPSLTRVLEILRPSGMDATVGGSVRITGKTVTCPRMDGCTLTGGEYCPDDQALIDTCPTC
jgi:hypothetical protein